jgi:hypothetical protein
VLKDLCLLLFVASFVFYFGNSILDGSLHRPENLSGELKSPPDSLYQWNIGEEAPFKYRLLHRAMVLGTYHVLSAEPDNATFLTVYRTYAFGFHVLAVLSFYLLLRYLCLGAGAFWGAFIFSVLPPFFMAYSVPVHTREDTLAYTLLSLGLLAMLSGRVWWMVLIFALGALCRETLLLLPLVNLLFNRPMGIAKRAAIFAVSIGIFGGVRWAVGMEVYNYWEGLKWNLGNGFQVIGFLYLTFGFLWLPFIAWMYKSIYHTENTAIIHKSSMTVLLVILTTTFLGGIFNEIRLLYLLAPWVITGAIQFFQGNRERIRLLTRSRPYLVFASIIFAVAAVSTLYLINGIQGWIESNYDIPYAPWITLAGIHGYLSIVTLPLFFSKGVVNLRYQE